MTKYPTYKESGTAWLGDVPQSWSVERLKRGFDLRKRPVRSSDGNVTAFRDGQVTLRSNRRTEGFTEADKEIGYQGVEPNDLVIHAMDAFAGAIGVSDSRGKSTPVYSVCRARSGYEPRFFALTLRHIALSGYITSLGKGVRERSTDFRWNDAQNVLVPVPPIDEQRVILRYLDSHTAKIDALIGKQELLIETLAERLDGSWSSAVRELTDSFPSVPLRRVIDSIVDGPFGSSLTSAHYSDEGAGVVRLGNIGIDAFKLADRAYVPLEYAQSLAAHAVRPGDVVVAGLGDEKMPLGRAAIVPAGFGTGIVKADCYRVRPGPRATAEYIAWILSSPQCRTQFRALSRGSTRQRLNTQVVRDVILPLPSPEVQAEAVARFQAARRSNELLVAKAREMIDVLKERRQALISAAVTGKIDVRGLT